MRCWMNQGTTMRFHDIEKDIEYCGKYGFEAIEFKYSLIQNQNLSWIRELLEKHGIMAGSVGALQLPILKTKKEKDLMETKLNDLCQCANLLRAKYVVAIPPRGADDKNHSLIGEEAGKILRRYTDIAAWYQLKIAFEVMGFADSYINTISEAFQIINQVKSDNLGLVYDFYHVLGMDASEQYVLVQEAKKAKKVYIVHVNDGIKCNVGNYPDDNRLWLGDGDVDLKNQMTILQNINYTGPFSIEVYQPEMWSFNIQECYKMAQKSIKKMQYIENMIYENRV